MKNDVLGYFRSFRYKMDGDIMLYVRLQEYKSFDWKIPRVAEYSCCPYCGSERLAWLTGSYIKDPVEGPGGWIYRKHGCGVMMAVTSADTTDGYMVLGVSLPTYGCTIRSCQADDDVI